MRAVKDLSDERLVELVRTKDQERYSEVVSRYQKKLLRYAERMVQDRDKAEDVVQGAFIKAFVNLNGFNTKRKFSSWIYRIVHNEAVNRIKKDKREVSLEDNKWLERRLEGKEDVERELDKKEIKKMVHSSLEKLPLKYRSILILFYFDEKTYEEISDVLRIPLGTVGVRLNRGRKLMRAVVTEKGGDVYVEKQKRS